MQGCSQILIPCRFLIVNPAIDLAGQEEILGSAETDLTLLQLLLDLQVFRSENLCHLVLQPFYYLCFDSFSPHQPLGAVQFLIQPVRIRIVIMDLIAGYSRVAPHRRTATGTVQDARQGINSPETFLVAVREDRPVQFSDLLGAGKGRLVHQRDMVSREKVQHFSPFAMLTIVINTAIR